MKTTPENRKYAFTLIETVVSISILTIAVVGPMTISSRSIHASSEARLSTEATYLATEAIEIMRSIRDNYLGDDPSAPRSPWVLGETGGQSVDAKCGPTTSGCVIDITGANNAGTVWSMGGGGGTIVSCGPGCSNQVYVKADGEGVYYRQSGGVINAAGWVPSPFTRIVRTNQITANMTRVTVTVTYRRTTGSMATVTIVDDLYNWFPYLVP